ncbi:MAG TPA: 5-deoxy-glucuronate isomerase, partial [Acidimicrobiales bacterium]|nr:5-deoxy-glucuronate isomerase [Acidimicrobiales bacterium]
MNSASLIRAGERTTYISLDVIAAEPGESIELGPGTERVAVILSGRAQVMVDGQDSGVIGGRGSVFEGPGDALYVPPTSSAALVPTRDGATDLSVAVAAAPAGPQPPGVARVIPAATQRETVVGSGSWGRTVRTILGPDDAASRLIVGETVHSDPGNWSSFPRHRHDRDTPDEVRLEEVYYYRVRPDNGFAVQVRYDTDTGGEELRIVRDGDAAAITSGFHPLVAAPGHDLYYLWILAGEQRAMRVYVDPRY